MQPRLLLLFITALPGLALAQTFKLTGTIRNALREPLPFVSVQVKGWQSGTLSDDVGKYTLNLEEGKYDIVYSIIGYKSQVVTIVIKRNYVQDILLEADQLALENVTVKARFKDNAVEIIKNVIRHKDSLQQAVGAWSGKLYIKAVQQDSSWKNKKAKTAKDTIAANRDIAGMAMTEISLQLDYGSPGKIKEQRLGVKKAGSSEDLFYLSATEGFFDFYNNLVKVPGLSPALFLSPISYSGLLGYKYKTLKTEKRGSYKWYTIGVKPRQMSNATIEGEVVISDSNWTIQHTIFRFPKFHLPQYDFFEVEQWYDTVQIHPALPVKQQFTYNSKTGKQKLSGITTVSFTDYEVNKQFPKNYFGVEVSATTAEAYKRDSSFWQSARTEPLTDKEIRFIHYKDSVFRVTNTKQYLDSIDKLTNRFTWKKFLLDGQTLYNRKLERTWQLPPLPALYQPFAFGGTRINANVNYYKTYPSRKNLAVFTDISYGFRNRDVNGSLSFRKLYNTFNRGFYGLTLRRDFDFIFQGDAWINMLKRSNQYLNNAFGIYHGLELANGLFLYTDVDVAFRRSLSDYKTGNAIDSILGEVLTENRAIAFQSYNAVYGKIQLEYTPRQRYIREPLEKVILGSKWPTFYTTWRKGVSGILDSKVDFDFWDIGIRQEISFGLLGTLHYNVNSGSFITSKDLRLVDYQFMRRGDPLLFSNPDASFQALDSTFALFKRFYQGHVVHEFNGYLINKIPLVKKLQLREVAGAGFLYAPERNLRYVEAFAGIERVFKWPFSPAAKFKLGVYVVTSAANKFNNPLTFKLGVTGWDKRRNRWY
jgi:hypothetical protein